ncbi:MAG TPA: choice-of-anchor Q domain-containing protein [Polyangiaceae bacterium]
MTFTPFRAVSLIVVAALMIVGCEPDATIRVTSTVDGASGSLRAAIWEANQAGKPVRIEVPTGTHELTICPDEDDDNSGGDLDLTSNANVMIAGSGPDVVVRQTCPGRILETHGAGVLTIVGIALTGGTENGDGGAIKGGSVVLTRVVLTGNKGRNGGGLAATTLTADELTVTNNIAAGRGGGVWVTTKAVIQRTNLSNNFAGDGGGIAVDGELVISLSRVLENKAAKYGSVLVGWNPLPLQFSASGAGILAKSVVANGVTVADNSLDACTVSLSLHGPSGVARGAGISADSATLVNSTISGNQARRECSSFQNLPRHYHVSSLAGGSGIAANQLELEHVTIAGNDGGTSVIQTAQLVTRASVAVAGSAGPLCESSVTAQGSHSWFSDTSCALMGADNRQATATFLLLPLADNGGPVPTNAPALGSPLLDSVPAAECRVATDARGIVRPQGTACDIGAVEVVQPPEVGPANLQLVFSAAPGSLVAGTSATWQLTVRNQGPSASSPSVWLQVPAELQIESLAASSSGVCHTRGPVACSFGVMPAGGSATIALTGRLVRYAPSVRVDATVAGPSLQPPLNDDRVTSTSPVIVDGAVRAAVVSLGSYVDVDLFSVGPAATAASSGAPIAVRFHPAPGVSVWSSQGQELFGIFASSETAIGSYRFWLSTDTAPPGDAPLPAKLGEVEVLSGHGDVQGPRTFEVYWAAPPDLALRMWRQPGAFREGEGIPVTIEVSNVGPAAAQRVLVSLSAQRNSGARDVDFGWNPVSMGGVESSASQAFWRIPKLDPGQTATLTGIFAGTEPGDELFGSTYEEVRFYDENRLNDSANVSIAPSPLGTADIRVEPLAIVVEPGTGRKIMRATVTNSGDADYAGPNAELVVSAYGGGLDLVSVVPPPGFTCSWPSRCDSAAPLAAGSSVTFEYVLPAQATGDASVWAQVNPAATPDPDLSNNSNTQPLP